MDTLKETGDFEAETNTRSEATGEVLRLIVDEFWRMQRERVGERELDGAKAYLTGSFPLTIETPEASYRAYVGNGAPDGPGRQSLWHKQCPTARGRSEPACPGLVGRAFASDSGAA